MGSDLWGDLESTLLHVASSHAGLIVGSALFFFVLQHVSFYLAVLYVPNFYLLPRKQQDDFAVRAACVVHCFLSFATIPGYFAPAWEEQVLLAPGSITTRFLDAIGLLNPVDPALDGLQVDHPYAYSPISQLFFGITAGYFLWDIFISNYYGWGVGFIAHAFASFGVYAISLHPFLHQTGRYFHGIFEISTLFLHLREMLTTAGYEKSIGHTVSSALFAATFLLVRVILGFPASYHLWVKLLALEESGKAHSDVVVYFSLAADGVIMTLQAIWCVQLLGAILGVGSTPSKKEEEPTKESKKKD